MANKLPARAEGYSWSLVFSTSQHGFSLNSLYRKMQKLESPILIVIEDTDHNVSYNFVIALNKIKKQKQYLGFWIFDFMCASCI